MAKAKKKRTRRKQPSPAAGEAAPAPPQTGCPTAAAPAYAAPAGPWLLHLLIVVLLVLGTCWLYRSDLDLGFFHVDDTGYVTENPWIKQANAENIGRILRAPYFANYSPLHLFSYMLDYAVAGENARAFHFSSNLWAGLGAGVLYLLGLTLVRSPLFALAAAVLFVVHPAHVEAVAWVSSRKDLVAAAFAIPAAHAYFLYRRGGPRARAWYAVCLGLFLLGVAGKLSVVVLPGILFVFDLAAERRRGWGLILDKIPFAVVVLGFALVVMKAQPPTRNEHDLLTLGHSLLKNLYLLTGFGDYVMNRGRPDPAAIPPALALLSRAAPFVLFLGPLLLWRRLSGVAMGLIYWVLLALIPPLVLSFVHPVTDRYLFFPSAGAVLLVAWSARAASRTRGRPVRIAAAAVLAAVAVLWARTTLAYLAEWQDPRSVWFAASTKTSDTVVYQYLGTHYQDVADQLPNDLKGDPAARERSRALARAVWAGDPRLDPLLKEWETEAGTGPVTADFQGALRDLAAEQFQKALRAKGTRVVPNLFFRLGKLALDTGQTAAAREQFNRAYQESQKHTSIDVRQELAVRSLHALALVAWRERNYEEALRLMREAETAQARSGRVWVAEIPQHRARLEGLVGK